jgi:hypothetical protein
LPYKEYAIPPAQLPILCDVCILTKKGLYPKPILGRKKERKKERKNKNNNKLVYSQTSSHQ